MATTADPHPEARALAEALKRWVPVALIDQAVADVLAAQQPVERGWVDITFAEMEAQADTFRLMVTPMESTLAACNAIARRRAADFRCHLNATETPAERASGVEGDR